MISAPARRARSPFAGGVVVPTLGVLAVLFAAVPLAVTVLQSFSPSTSFDLRLTGLTTHWYGEFFGDPTLRDALATSLKISIPVTLVDVVVGVIAAYGFHRVDFKGKRALELVIIVPGVLPPLLLGIGMSLLYRYFIPGTTSLLPTILGEATLFLPFAFFLSLMGFRGTDPNLRLAAMDLGASELTIFRRVTLPAVAPWLAGAALIIFPLSFNEVVFTTFLLNQGTTLPIYIYSAMRDGVTPEVGAVAGFLALCTVALSVIAVIALPRLQQRRARR